MSDSPIRYRLPNISPKAYEHPADRAATAALQSIPMLDQVVKGLMEFGFERIFRQILLGNSVKVGPDQLPHIWKSYQHVLDTLDMPNEYDLYIMQTPIANAFAFGSSNPIIVLNSGLVSLLDDAQLQSVLAHEAGHILSDHVLYRTVLILLLNLGQAARLPFLVGLPVQAIIMALREWQRAAELSSDRAATLVVRDPLITCRTMMHLAGGSSSEKFNLDAFIKQATEYEEWEDGYDRLVRFFPELYSTHPFPVRRVSELMKWVQSGEFDRIIRGEYRKRDDDVNVRKEAGDAFEHYKDRFQTIFDEIDFWIRGANGNAKTQSRKQKQSA